MLLEKIKNLCFKNSISISKLERETGISNNAISKWNKSSPSLDTIKKVANYFKIPIDYFANEIEEDPIKKIGGYNIDPNNLIKAPIYGTVVAGIGGYAKQDLQGYEYIDINDIKGDVKDFFYLRVAGDSMNPKIEEDDLVLVQATNYVESGAMAVIMIDNEEAVVKYIHYDNETITLKSANPYYPDRIFKDNKREEIFIIGQVKQIKRNI